MGNQWPPQPDRSGDTICRLSHKQIVVAALPIVAQVFCAGVYVPCISGISSYDFSHKNLVFAASKPS